MAPKNKNKKKKEETKKERDAREKQESKLLDECIAANIENLKETKISEDEEKKKQEEVKQEEEVKGGEDESERPERLCGVKAICDLCGALSARFVCQKCFRVYYCSIDCQTAAWLNGAHRKKCKTLAEQKVANHALLEAVRDGNMQAVRDLINAGVANVNFVDPETGGSVLMWAIGIDHIQIVKALTDAQADVNYAIPAYVGDPEFEGTTALMSASQ